MIKAPLTRRFSGSGGLPTKALPPHNKVQK
jgi:hypothetical protein